MKILVVDDTEDTVEILGASLSRYFEVECYTRGIEALTAIMASIRDGKQFDFLLLDAAMPHLDAFTIAQIVRLVENTGLTKTRHRIGVLTAYAETVERSSLLERSGIDFYWRKPEHIVELPQLILAAIGQVVG